jgi:cytochrome c oxidase subunit 2
MATTVWNGFCTEYCGAQHGEMHFRVVTVDPAQFTSWAAHESAPAVFNVGPAPAAPVTANPIPAAAVTQPTAEKAGTPASPIPGPNAVSNATTTTQTPTAAAAAGFVLPRAQVPEYAIPHTPLPEGLAFDDHLTGDPARGQALFTGAGTCNACHTVRGNPLAAGVVGPDLTHVGSRIGIAGMMYVNDAPHLARWIKNARMMKLGSIMPTLGKGQYDPELKSTNSAGLTDQQIADIVAYLQALK